MEITLGLAIGLLLVLSAGVALIFTDPANTRRDPPKE